MCALLSCATGTTAKSAATKCPIALAVCSSLIATTTSAFAATKEKVLWSFNYEDGNEPNGGLVFDGSGNLYGTTLSGGGPNSGVLFELVRDSSGRWTEKELWAFCGRSQCEDGGGPETGLLFDATGNLYGTTAYGGTHNGGVVFQLSPGSHGTWHQTVLHNFGNGTDGTRPSGGLIFDTAGNLYGTTILGGATAASGSCYAGCGTVFQLKPGKNGE